MRIKEFSLPTGQLLHYIGPDMSWGALPTIFYFSIGGRDSLGLDPFNQPVAIWDNLPLRVCSLDLPHHSSEDDPTEALGAWAKDFQAGKDPIQTFLDLTLSSLNHLLQEELIQTHLGFAGLSRGAFIAAHLMAKFPAAHLLGFAPLTRLIATKEFSAEASLHEKANVWDLKNLSDKLCRKEIRFYIGNQDTRVGTRNCFDCMESFCLKAAEENLRSPPLEMIMLPSIGHQGHGTAKSTFTEGAIWLAKKLGVPDEAFEP